MGAIDVTSTEELRLQALVQMRSALDLLDRSQAPADIGAHLDLAINRLMEATGIDQVPVQPVQSIGNGQSSK